jgi:hypothetical protein
MLEYAIKFVSDLQKVCGTSVSAPNKNDLSSENKS